MTCGSGVLWGAAFLLLFLLPQPTVPLKFICNKITCSLDNLNIDEEYHFAFEYPINGTRELTISFAKGEVFDLSLLPNLSNLRHFVLQHSQLDSLILKLTANNSTVNIMETPLKSVIFHETHNLVDVRIDRSHLTTIPDTIFVQESLETLFITRSLLTTIDFDLFEKLPNLQFISFYSNKISVVHSTPGIACCGRWLSLDLQNNRLEKFDLGVLSFMSCMKTVSLRTNRLLTIENNVPSETPPGMRRSCQSYDYQASVSADRFSSLNTIDLENNRLRVVNLSMFHDMPHLTDLMLARNLLMNVIVHNGLLPKRLESIDLSFNRMANADFRPLLSVKVVNVGGNL